MAQSNFTKVLSRPDFDAENYVREIGSGGDGYKDLLDHRRRVQNLSDETAVAMKKNVYKNYTQFIETAKEISCILYRLCFTLQNLQIVIPVLLVLPHVTDCQDIFNLI
ncbi:exocyst complex component 8-like [Saccoglossus kowalevskii]